MKNWEMNGRDFINSSTNVFTTYNPFQHIQSMIIFSSVCTWHTHTHTTAMETMESFIPSSADEREREKKKYLRMMSPHLFVHMFVKSTIFFHIDCSSYWVPMKTQAFSMKFNSIKWKKKISFKYENIDRKPIQKLPGLR